MEEIIKENEHSKKVKITKKKIIIISIISLLIIGGIVAALLIKNNIDKTNAEKYRNEYKHNLRLVTYQMLYGASDAEKCGNKINSVWHNSIWKKDDPETDKYTKTNGIFNEDFNDSLNALFLDSEYIDLTDKIEDNQTEVNRLMKLLKNPSDEFVEAYSDLKDYYDSYFNLTNLCTNPSGSLQTYSSNFSDADNDTIIKYNKMKNYLDN